PSDLEVAARVSLLAPTGRAEQLERPLIARLDVGLEAMEPELAEGVPEHERHRFAHVAVAGVRDERVVPEVRVAERPVMDLREGIDTDERLLVIDDDGERMTGGMELDVSVEGVGAVGRIRPGMMQRTAPCDGLEEGSAVTGREPTERRPR